jgi:ABC-type Fe3+/spermidine/putrescine transport system ATPase subunit
MDSPHAGLNLLDLHKTYPPEAPGAGPGFTIHLSLHVAQGEIVAILGPSGSGKSTLLSLVAGLETPDSGQILWDDQDLAAPGRAVPTHRRGFGLMFQDFALFPHLNVFDNIAFGLRLPPPLAPLSWRDRRSAPGISAATQSPWMSLRGAKRRSNLRASAASEDISSRVQEVLALVGLPGFERRDVNTLSGGEMQRVALARSLAPRPRLLMLDEPLGALDRGLRERLVTDLRHILRASQQTAVYVTHDQEEAFTLADRVAVMNAGRLIQVDTPQKIYRQPASTFVARFLSLGNLVSATLSAGQPFAETPLGRLPLPHPPPSTPCQSCTLLLRPDAFSLAGPGPAELSGILVEASFRGVICRITLRISEQLLDFDLPSAEFNASPGDTLRLAYDPRQAIQVLEPDST